MPRKSTNTKARILNTATNLFSSHGFAGTSIDDILQAVGITKGAFYHYFHSKDHLCQAVLDIAISEYHQLAESVQDTPDASQRLYRWLEVLIQKQTSGQWLHCRLMTRLSIESAQLSAVMQQKLRNFWQWYQGFYEDLIRLRLPNSDGNSMDPAATARLFMAAHFGALWLDRCAPAKEDIITVCETLLGKVIP